MSMLIAAGCGSDSSSEPRLTKAAFIKKGNAICSETEQEQLVRAAAYLKQNPHAADEDLLAPAVFPTIEKTIRELGSLSAPTEDEAKIAALLTEFENGLAKTKQANPEAVFTERVNPMAKADALARNYGLEACSHAP